MIFDEHTTTFHRESGFVLVAVIWIAGLLAVVATAITLSLRSHMILTGNGAQLAKLETVADGMIELKAFRLATAPASTPQAFNLNGMPVSCAWSDGVTVDVAVQDAGGLVDVNAASPLLMHALLRGLGVAEDRAQTIERDLLDFRDPDSVGQDGRPEPVTYPGKNFGPKNAPLAVAEELDQVPGINGELFRKMRPFVTVLSQQPGIDLGKAPPQLIKILAAGLGSVEKLQAFASPSPGKIFEIDATARFGDGMRYRRQAEIVILHQPSRPFAVLSWRRGTDDGEPDANVVPSVPCLN